MGPSDAARHRLYVYCSVPFTVLLMLYSAVAEIAIEKCYIDPEFVRGMCEPKTVTQDDAIKGKWVRVGPDLNQETSLTYLVSVPSRNSQVPSSPVTSISISIIAVLDDWMFR